MFGKVANTVVPVIVKASNDSSENLSIARYPCEVNVHLRIIGSIIFKCLAGVENFAMVIVVKTGAANPTRKRFEGAYCPFRSIMSVQIWLTLFRRLRCAYPMTA